MFIFTIRINSRRYELGINNPKKICYTRQVKSESIIIYRKNLSDLIVVTNIYRLFISKFYHLNSLLFTNQYKIIIYFFKFMYLLFTFLLSLQIVLYSLFFMESYIHSLLYLIIFINYNFPYLKLFFCISCLIVSIKISLFFIISSEKPFYTIIFHFIYVQILNSIQSIFKLLSFQSSYLIHSDILIISLNYYLNYKLCF